jgi:predicted O-methyltransferase YrrM
MSNDNEPDIIPERAHDQWFRRGALANFERYAAAPIDYYLEIGTWAGASLFWVLEHLRPRVAIAIDPYPADRKRSAAYNAKIGDAVQARWQAEYPDVPGVLYRQPSEHVLPYLLECGFAFELAYIDGSHHGADVFFDLACASRLVAPGGLLIVDDFTAARRGGVAGLRAAVDAFQRTHADDYRLLFVNHQVGLQRRPQRITKPGQPAGLAPSILAAGEWEVPPATLRRDTADGIVNQQTR